MSKELSICVLGSSSAGNSTVIWNSGGAILIDCGFGPSYIAKQLQDLGLAIQGLQGVFMTHIHSDHVNEWAISRFIHERVPLYCPPNIEPYLKKKYPSVGLASHRGLLRTIKKSEIALDHFLVRHFEVPHDSEGGCFGYSVLFEDGGTEKKVSVSTDIACPTKSAVRHMVDSDVLVLESNYDVQMLEDSARPAWLKRRIREEGHLSNVQCSETVLQVLDQSKSLPTSLMLAHVSRECNTNKLARECTEKALEGKGIRGINIIETHPDKPGRTISI